MPEKKNLIVTKKTMREQIVDILREQILRAEIAPGERIIEEDVAAQFEVSRGPVREALRQIEEEGLITYIPHKGCEVKVMTPEEMRESYLIRSTLEGLAVSIYSGKMSEEGKSQLHENVTMMVKAAERKDLYSIVMADEGFHETIVEEAKCNRLLQMWRSLIGGNTAAYYTMKSTGLMAYGSLGRNHQRLLDLFERDASVEEICKAIGEHYMIVPDTLKNAVTAAQQNTK